MFQRIFWILTSPDGSVKIPVRRRLNLEIYSALIEYKNGKSQTSRLSYSYRDYDDLDDQQEEWVPEQ